MGKEVSDQSPSRLQQHPFRNIHHHLEYTALPEPSHLQKYPILFYQILCFVFHPILGILGSIKFRRQRGNKLI